MVLNPRLPTGRRPLPEEYYGPKLSTAGDTGNAAPGRPVPKSTPGGPAPVLVDLRTISCVDVRPGTILPPPSPPCPSPTQVLL